jgi:hypothetical protein
MHPSVTIVGKVVRKRINLGSKSERRAIVLVGAERDFVLRRRGATSYSDDELESLIGKKVRATGIVSAGQLIMSAYAVIEPEA